MAASVTALATVVWSDIAEATEPAQVMLADEVTTPRPVKVAKIEHKPTEEELLLADLEMAKPKPTKPRRKRLDFGSFEGY